MISILSFLIQILNRPIYKYYVGRVFLAKQIVLPVVAVLHK